MAKRRLQVPGPPSCTMDQLKRMLSGAMPEEAVRGLLLEGRAVLRLKSPLVVGKAKWNFNNILRRLY